MKLNKYAVQFINSVCSNPADPENFICLARPDGSFWLMVRDDDFKHHYVCESDTNLKYWELAHICSLNFGGIE